MAYEAVIGLEIHAELKTKTKMFCHSLNDPDEKHPNTNVCPICLGHPGTLPVINEEAVRTVQRVGLAMNCELAEFSKFDRKNYFYPDLPKGYQISQYDLPFCRGGYLDIGISHIANGKSQDDKRHATGEKRRIRLTRIHLEEDTGKLLHPEKGKESLVDFNRAGVPLMELVTEPDIRSGKEARAFAEELQRILRYLGASEANMEKGEMRIEVNISLRKKHRTTQNGTQNNTKPLGTKVEIKNLNSFRSVERAVDYEIERQAGLLEAGKKVVQETRGWHDEEQKTFSQRKKEEAHDYRYFPEPDLPPLRFTQTHFAELRAAIPELPQQRRERFAEEYGLASKDIEIFVVEKHLGDYFEQVASELRQWHKEQERKVAEPDLHKLAANYLISELQKILFEREETIATLKITPENFAEFILLIHEGKISSKAAKAILETMYKTGQDPSDIVVEQGLEQVSDERVIEEDVVKVLAGNPEAVADFRKGKGNALQFLVGKVMAQTRGKANPSVVLEILTRQLQE